MNLLGTGTALPEATPHGGLVLPPGNVVEYAKNVENQTGGSKFCR